MRKPFVLYEMCKKKKAKKSERLVAPMRGYATQYEWFLHPKETSPEKALGLAVLQRAVLDLITPGVSERDRISALEWIDGSRGRDFEENYALSFSRIVEGFTDIGVEEFRAKILNFSETAKKSVSLADGFRFQRN